MKKFEYVIKDECGIHARPAGLLVKQAKLFEAQITVSKGEKTADAKKILSLMGLCIKKGDQVNVTAEGVDEAEAIQAARDFFANNL